MASNQVQIVITAKDEAAAIFAQINKNVDDTKRNVESKFSKLGARGWRDFSTQASQSFNNVANGIAGLAKVVGGFLVGGAVGMGAFIKQASDLQSIRASFQSMTGSAEEARQVLQQLNEFSFKTAFSTQAINDAARTFLGAGLEVKNLGSVMSNVGDIAGATGADLGRLTLPLSQAMARGKLQTQDFYQILDSGAGKLGQVLREEVAKRGMGDFMKAMEEGKVSSELLFDVVEKSAQKGGFAFEGALKQSKTFDGQMSNLMETIGNVGLKILGVDKATGEIDKDGIFAKLSKSVQDATEWLNKNQDTIKDVAMILIDNAVPAISGLAAAFVVAKVAAIGFAIAAGANPIGLIITAISALIAALVFLQVKFNIFGVAWEWIKSVWGGAVAFFTGIWNGIAAGVTGFFNGVVQIFTNIINFIRTWGLTILAVIFWPFSLALGLIFTFKDQISAVFRAIWNVIVAIFTPIGNWFGRRWNDIKNVFSGVAGWFRSVFSGAWNGIKSIFGAVGGFFRGVWNTITGIFRGVGTAIGNAIGGSVKSVVNSILGFAEGAINGFIRAINTAIGVINAIPGVNIPKVGELNIPRLAKGTNFSQEGIHLVGENGPELAYLGRGSRVLPAQRTANALADAKSRGDTNITVNVKAYTPMDYRKLASDMGYMVSQA